MTPSNNSVKALIFTDTWYLPTIGWSRNSIRRAWSRAASASPRRASSRRCASASSSTRAWSSSNAYASASNGGTARYLNKNFTDRYTKTNKGDSTSSRLKKKSRETKPISRTISSINRLASTSTCRETSAWWPRFKYHRSKRKSLPNLLNTPPH